MALAMAPAASQLAVEIVGSSLKRVELTLVSLQGDVALTQPFGDVVERDLTSSGVFRISRAQPTQMLPAAQPSVLTPGAEVVVDGKMTIDEKSNLNAHVRVFDTVSGRLLGEKIFIASERYLRALSHNVADYIYEAVLAVPGVFSTRLLFVSAQSNGRYALSIADADGFSPQTALSSTTPLISPVWSPDGKRFAYVSFEDRRPVIYIQELTSGRRFAVANFPGSNSAPDWSPDGRQMAVVLTKDGGSHIYQINADGRNVKPLVTSTGIDTEPRYSADGKSLYFTSDRGGSPQIYQLDLTRGDARRLTFEGRYNVSPAPSPDGRSLAYISRDDSAGFVLRLMDLQSGQSVPLASTLRGERPSFAPNGRYIIYANTVRGRDVLSVTSTDGNTSYNLALPGAKIYEADWGPLKKP